MTGCGKPKTPPISERIAKVWSARTVDHNKVTVYTKGAATNVQNYASFKLDLSAPPAVRYTEFDGNTFVGKYTVTDQSLTLTDLTPAPSGVPTGSIAFNITGISDAELKLARTSSSQKTGGSTNDYTLSNP